MYNTDGCQSICLYMKQLVFLIGILDSQIPSKGVVSIQNETKPMKGDESKKQKRLRQRERICILGWLDSHSLTVWVSLVMGNWVSDSHRGASGREREREVNGGMSKAEQWRSVNWKTRGASLWTHSSRAVEPVWGFFPQTLVCIKAWQRAPLNIICLHGHARGLFHCL